MKLIGDTARQRGCHVLLGHFRPAFASTLSYQMHLIVIAAESAGPR